MTAKDLLKSLTLTPGINVNEMKVITLYKNQDPEAFLVDNFTDKIIRKCEPEIKSLAIMNSRDYLVVNSVLDTPDGKSTLQPDHTLAIYDVNRGDVPVFLYEIN